MSLGPEEETGGRQTSVKHGALPNLSFSFLTPKSHLPPNGGTLTSQMPRLRSRALQGLPMGRAAAAQGSFAAVRFGALALGGGAPGFSRIALQAIQKKKALIS